MESCHRHNKEVIVKNETFLTKEDTENVDLIISLGGDHTYLHTSSYLSDCTKPLMGINTQVLTENGNLLGNKIKTDQARADADLIL